MKTKILFKTILLAILMMAFISCKKSNPSKQGTLNGTWSTNQWGGVNGNVCTWATNSNATAGVITQLGSQSFNFSTGDQIYFNITASGSGTYNAMGKYTYGVGNANSATRPCTLTLNNSNTLTADYPPITSGVNAGFGEIIYVYQKQ